MRPIRGLTINRFFTTPDIDPIKDIEYIERDCRITKQDGSIVFEMKNLRNPKRMKKDASQVYLEKALETLKNQKIQSFLHPSTTTRMLYSIG